MSLVSFILSNPEHKDIDRYLSALSQEELSELVCSLTRYLEARLGCSLFGYHKDDLPPDFPGTLHEYQREFEETTPYRRLHDRLLEEIFRDLNLDDH